MQNDTAMETKYVGSSVDAGNVIQLYRLFFFR